MQSALLILVLIIPAITVMTILSGFVLHYFVASKRGWKHPKATSILISFIIMAFLYAATLLLYVNATTKEFNNASYFMPAVIFFTIIIMGIANFTFMRSIEKENKVEDRNSLKTDKNS